jgi:DNA-directed RNA polymerase specialized sigma24 family protein
VKPGDRTDADPGPSAEVDDLGRRALYGDDGAWAELVRRHDRQLVVRLLAGGLRLDRARDVAQATWARLVEQQRQGRLTAVTMPGHLFVQARWILKEERRGGTWPAASAEAPEDRPAPEATPEAQVAARQILARAITELDAATATQREVFLLALAPPGLTHEAIARRVGLSVQRVRQIVCEVRQRLRAAMAEDGT